jgi:hypothetical protein
LIAFWTKNLKRLQKSSILTAIAVDSEERYGI